MDGAAEEAYPLRVRCGGADTSTRGPSETGVTRTEASRSQKLKTLGNAPQTKVRVTDRRAVDVALGQARLNREEELVLRLRHGLGLAHETALEFRGGNVELRARLALMEASALEHLAEASAAAHEAAVEDAHELRLGALVDRLRRI